jgi:hypothetical protein
LDGGESVANQRAGNLQLNQWHPQCPPQPCPPLRGFLAEGDSAAPAAANVENFLDNFFEPQCGHSEFFQSVERTRISLSRSHFSQ